LKFSDIKAGTTLKYQSGTYISLDYVLAKFDNYVYMIEFLHEEDDNYEAKLLYHWDYQNTYALTAYIIEGDGSWGPNE
jgi:hypothetical protein